MSNNVEFEYVWFGIAICMALLHGLPRIRFYIVLNFHLDRRRSIRIFQCQFFFHSGQFARANINICCRANRRGYVAGAQWDEIPSNTCDTVRTNMERRFRAQPKTMRGSLGLLATSRWVISVAAASGGPVYVLQADPELRSKQNN